MKKTTVKKLVLAKETVRSMNAGGARLLEAKELANAQGASGISCYNKCYSPDEISNVC